MRSNHTTPMRLSRRRPVGLSLTSLAMVLAIAIPLLASARGDDDLDREAFVAKAKEQVKVLMKELEALRGDKFTGEVGVSIMSHEEFRTYLNEAMDKDFPKEESDAMQKTYVRLGVLPASFNLRDGMVDMMVSQAGAFYDPERSTFYVVKADLPASTMEPMMLHELEHALQDQMFNLADILKGAEDAQNDDRVTAVRFVVEGEANYLMTVYALKKQQGMDLESMGPMAGPMLRMQAEMDKDTMVEMSRMQAQMGGGSKSMVESAKALEKIPNFLFRTLVDPYNKGQYMIWQVKSKGGWKAVNALFENPPLSTEQVLHPEKLSGPGRDDPTPVVLPDLASGLGNGWTTLHENTLGEHGMAALFEEQLRSPKKAKDKKPVNPMQALMGGGKKSEGDVAAAGWDGDRYVALEGPDGDVVLVWRSTWDSEKDAREFHKTYAKVIRRKLRAGGKQLERGQGSFVWRSDDGVARVTRRGSDVVVIEGAPAGELAASLEAAAFSGSAPTAAVPSAASPKPSRRGKAKLY